MNETSLKGKRITYYDIRGERCNGVVVEERTMRGRLREEIWRKVENDNGPNSLTQDGLDLVKPSDII